MRTRLFDRQEVYRPAEQEMAQFVEGLPRRSYEQVPKQLDGSRPVIVYCADQLCDLSPQAAARLEQRGFEQVYDYVLGKADRLAAGLPHEGRLSEVRPAGDVADRNVLTRPADQRLGPLPDRMTCTGTDAVPVTDPEGRRAAGGPA